ncbi:hypothetical protein D3C84_977520 [compost metagenome]
MFVRILTRILKIIVKANPRMAPLPITYRTTLAIIFVMFASIIVRSEFFEPDLSEDSKLLSLRISSLIRSYMMMFASTAMPTPSTNAAMPGKVSVAFIRLNTSRSSHT